MSELEQAVRSWILAEYAFRLGRRPYTAAAQDQLVDAERDLRRALTGKGSLRRAAQQLNPALSDGADSAKPRVKPRVKILPRATLDAHQARGIDKLKFNS